MLVRRQEVHQLSELVRIVERLRALGIVRVHLVLAVLEAVADNRLELLDAAFG